MDARIQELPFDPAALSGLSEKLLRSHHQNNYGGAVKRLNAIRSQLAGLPFATAPGFHLNGLKREELIATNSMLLHELYFGSLAGADKASQPMQPAMALALAANFGSVERWREEFVAMGKALGGGSGWVLLVFQPREGTLVNQWAADHTHVLAGGVPLLALDMYEHAYHMDYCSAAGAYVDAFMNNIAWARRVRALPACGSGQQRGLGCDAGRCRGRTRRGRAPGRRFRCSSHGDPGIALARPGGCRQLGRRVAHRPRRGRVLRLRPRGRARHRHAPARGGHPSAPPAGWYRRLAGGGPACDPQGRSPMK